MTPLPHAARAPTLRRRLRDALGRMHAALGGTGRDGAGDGRRERSPSAMPDAPPVETRPETQPLPEPVVQPELGAQALQELETRLQELELALRASQETSQAKSKFLAKLSHEIRTPMSGVLGMCQLLADTPLDDTQRNYVELMQRSTQGLLGLLGELLDFSHLESGQLGLEPQAVQLRVLLDEAAAAVHAQAADKGLLFECDLAADLPSVVRADAPRLRQACLHLLHNALKFTCIGQVLLSARRSDHGIVIEVSDTGEGMDDELQQRAFAPFVQGDDSVARRHGGIGLGLTVVETLAHAMDGHVEVDSALGRGSTFGLHLPLPVLELDDPPLSADPSRRVAVVSDAPASQLALRARLAHLRHEVVAVISWRELAFDPEAVVALQPDVVLYDEPLEGWPRNVAPLAGDRPPPPWVPVLLQRRAEPVEAQAGTLRLQRPLSDAALSRVLQFPERPAAMAETPAAPVPSSGRVLLVEDNEVNQIVAQSFLEHLGYEVDLAADADTALSSLHARDYAAVLMDWQLPGIDGCELTRRMRAGEAGLRAQRTPVIALTAHATPGDRERCLAAGMNDYLAKPVDPQQLGATLSWWLSADRAAAAAMPV